MLIGPTTSKTSFSVVVVWVKGSVEDIHRRSDLELHWVKASVDNTWYPVSAFFQEAEHGLFEFW